MARADQMRNGWTPLAPLYVETVIGQTHDTATSRIFEAFSIPNQSMKAGTRVKVGTDIPSAISGSKNQWSERLSMAA